MGAIFHNGKIYSGGGLLNLVTKSWSDYSALSLEEKNDSTKWYFVPDAPASGVPNIVKSVRDNITDVYDPESTYNKDDWCIYDNKLYICTTNNTTGEWDSTKWTRNNLKGIIGSLNSAIAPQYGTFDVGSSNYTASRLLVMKQGKLCNFSVSIQNSGTWVSQSSWQYLGTISEGFRPLMAVRVMADDNTHDVAIVVNITPDGRVSMIVTSASSGMKNILINACYVV